MKCLKTATQAVITTDPTINDWVIRLVEQCLSFYSNSTKDTKIVLIKDTISRDGNIGLTIADMEGFILYWQNIQGISAKHEKSGVNPYATEAHLIVDTIFHEMHHVSSYKEDYEWVLSHKEDEEEMANEVAKDLTLDFFKEIKVEIPQNLPYIYKNEKEVITDLREFMNILLDEDNKWDALGAPPIITIEETSISPEAPAAIEIAVNGEDALSLYTKCFNKIFNKCIPTHIGFNAAENIVEPITSTNNIIKSAVVMAIDGTTYGSNVLSGLIFKNSKLPGYDFILADGKKRRIIPQNPQKRDTAGNFTSNATKAQAGAKIGYVIDSASDKFLLKYENGTFTSC